MTWGGGGRRGRQPFRASHDDTNIGRPKPSINAHSFFVCALSSVASPFSSAHGGTVGSMACVSACACEWAYVICPWRACECAVLGVFVPWMPCAPAGSRRLSVAELRHPAP
ncbi:hypothetical protein ACQJBY_027432 [Aegilops geniculata]